MVTRRCGVSNCDRGRRGSRRRPGRGGQTLRPGSGQPAPSLWSCSSAGGTNQYKKHQLWVASVCFCFALKDTLIPLFLKEHSTMTCISILTDTECLISHHISSGIF